MSYVYCIGGVLQFAPNTSLGFVSNSNDATGTLTRHVKVSLACIFIWSAPLGHCKGMFGNKLECIFLTKTGSNGRALKQDGPELD